MKYQRLISNNKFLFIIIICFTIFLLISCKDNHLPKKTKEFYVNDHANAFHPITKKAIVLEGEHLYKTTKNINEIGGAQIVFLTILINDLDDIAKYNKTDIYRNWKIGKNDMGILIIMFFTEGMENERNYLYLEETQIEIGYRMEQYFPASRVGRILDDTLYSNAYDDLDVKVAFLLYEILKVVYEELYYEYYSSFTYDLEYFQEVKDNYVPNIDQDKYQKDYWLLLILALLLDNWLLLIPAGAIILFGGLIYGRNRGGGGSSGGYGIFRRR